MVGERLGSVDHYKAGEGTYVRHGFIFSNLAGYKRTTPVDDGEVSNWKGSLSNVSY